jgi:hypothetical protein
MTGKCGRTRDLGAKLVLKVSNKVQAAINSACRMNFGSFTIKFTVRSHEQSLKHCLEDSPYQPKHNKVLILYSGEGWKCDIPGHFIT